MTMPWEDSLSDATRALSVYTIMRNSVLWTSTPLYTKAEIHAFYDDLERAQSGDPGGFPGISTTYVDIGTAYLEANGFVTVAGSTLTPTTVVDGKPAPIRRVPGNDSALEFVP